MNRERDLEDWVGGYPFEYATPQEIREFVEPLGFELVWEQTGPSMAFINEFLFRRVR